MEDQQLTLGTAPVYSIHPAVPFSTLVETVLLPDNRAFPKELKTIGDHLKKASLERKILIKDVII